MRYLHVDVPRPSKNANELWLGSSLAQYEISRARPIQNQTGDDQGNTDEGLVNETDDSSSVSRLGTDDA